MELGLIPLFGLMNRLGGGLVKLGSTQLARVLFRSLPTALVLFFVYQNYWLFSAVLFLGWLGWVCAEYSKYWNLKSFKDWMMMALNGLIISLPALPLFYYDWRAGLILLLPGLLMPVAYFLGWKTPNISRGFYQGPEMGEVYFGMVRGISLWAILQL